jgi:predicted RNase H-like HicB family nuclease
MYYLALVHELNGTFGVSFPDFPGCVTAVSSLAELQSKAEECLQFHVDGMLKDGDLIPEPSIVDGLAAALDSQDLWAWILVKVQVEEKTA